MRSPTVRESGSESSALVIREGRGSSLRRDARLPLRWLLRRAHRGLVSARTVPGFELALELQSLRTVGKFFFVQVGAQDGVTGDPIHQYVHQDRWHSVLVEPRRAPFEALQRTYEGCAGLRFLNVAITAEAGERDLHFVRDDEGSLPAWVQGLGSFRREVLLSHEAEVPDLRAKLARERVTCRTWDTVLALVPPTGLDLLQLDVEGLDYELLRRFPFDQFAPGVVRYEHKHLTAEEKSDCGELLSNRGYVLIVEAQDTTAYARSWPPT